MNTTESNMLASNAPSGHDYPVTIYHNPNCGTSRNVLALIRNAGIEPTVIEYLVTPPGKQKLIDLIQAMRVPVRTILRQKGTPYDELGLGEDRFTDEELIDFMVQYPILMNRPIVVTPDKTTLCRPSETVLDVLDRPQRGPFYKEDGEMVVNEDGTRVK